MIYSLRRMAMISSLAVESERFGRVKTCARIPTLHRVANLSHDYQPIWRIRSRIIAL